VLIKKGAYTKMKRLRNQKVTAQAMSSRGRETSNAETILEREIASVAQRSSTLAVAFPHNDKRSKQLGLSLVELLMALAALTVVALAVSTLEFSGVRLNDRAHSEVGLKQQLDYVLRDIERNITSAQNPITDPDQITGCVTECLSVEREDDKGLVTIDYMYDENDKSISRRFTDAADTVSTKILSSGIVIRKNEGEAELDPLFEILGGETHDIVNINLSAEVAQQGRTLRLKGITKSILLRGQKG
jgi:hypothetical protein